MSSCSYRVDGKLFRWVLKLNGENGIYSCVSVLNLHVQIGKGCAVGNILRNGDLVFLLVKSWRFIIDITNGYSDVSS